MTNVAAPSWPGLAGLKLQPLQIERAVWGKVHGQTSDFRWIARSDGLALDSTLHQALSLGSEDKPRDAVCWRALEDCFVAMRIYPSRARDAASRSGFLEKQLLILRRHEEIPAALAAMVLLPRVAQMSDQVWWPYRESSDWSRPDFVLKLESQENLPITVSADELKTRIELGTSELKEKIGMDQLASLYQALSDGLRPTFLPDLDQPLSPEALATLLLPLERAKADQLSLAGWIPSARVQTEGLANWDLVIGINQQFSAKEPPLSKTSALAWQMVLALFENDPSALAPGQTPPQFADSPPQQAESHPGSVQEAKMTLQQEAERWSQECACRLSRPGQKLKLTEDPTIPTDLFEFARDADTRWVDTKTLNLNGSKANRASLDRLINETEAYRPYGAHKEQWAAKVQILREVAGRLISADLSKA